jgi:hypothetical protein
MQQRFALYSDLILYRTFSAISFCGCQLTKTR